MSLIRHPSLSRSSALARRTALVAAIVLGLGLAGCSDKPAAPAAVKLDAAAAQRAATAIAGPAWLRERLPEHTVGYLRIPTLWSMTAAPNGRALDAALASEAHTRLIAELRANIGKDALLQKAGIAPAMMLLLDDLAAPVEIAVIDGSDIANPASNMLLSAQLKFADVAALNARLAELKVPLLQAPLDEHGKGKLTSNGFVYFDAKTGRLYALLGMAASALALDGLVQQTAQTRSHPMHAQEKQIDASGQGLFYWMSLKGVTGMASAQLPAAKPGTLLRDFLDRGQSIAAGWGTVEGRGRLTFQIVAPEARLLSYIAPTDFKAAVKTAGKPRWAVSMALPTTAQFGQIEANLDQDFGAGTHERYAEAKKGWLDTVGADPQELLGLLGGQAVVFEDEAGLFSALHVADRKALYARLDELAAKHHWKRETVTAANTSVNHLHMSWAEAIKPAADAADTEGALDAWLGLYGRVGNHLYWVEEGEYLIFGSVPQALADRAQSKLDTDLGAWMRNNQSYDPNATWLGLTATTRNAQREIYYAYLGGLQSLGDFLGQEINLASLPNAAGLKLPVEGATGLSIDATRDRLGLSLTYEQNPAEVLMSSGGLGAVAIAGILAAVAVPAYDDYVVRTQVSQVIGDAAAMKTSIAEIYATTGKLPSSEDEPADLAGFGEMAKYLDSYYVDSGAIVMVFGDEANAALHGKTLILRPYQQGGQLIWQCGDSAVLEDAEPLSSNEETNTVATKHLPSECK
ncbi:pilin [Tahibacter aquaticus]|uniref:Pilin n=1 Tax=Tahibacter aquaticus TaxID=520092 RepID=A0A4R6Z2Q0_9GAMM|nr:pilin [Tahibacter aquaticus]TDR45871.1 pilin [Tahibacter aquaticus]